MNLLALNDSKLATLHRQAAVEIARRAKAATNGYDAATIICGNECETGLAGRRCRKPLNPFRRSAELRQDDAAGRGPGTWPG